MDFLSNELVGRMLDAVLFAAEKHKFQSRKTGGSYITHPLSVCKRLHNSGETDLATLQAAVLHDTVEDTETTLEEIKEKFGSRVASIVSEVTDDKSLTKDERKRMQVVHAKTSSSEAFSIKMADALDNLTDLLHSPPPSWSEERIKGYFVWKKAVVSQRGKSCNENLYAELESVFEQIIQPQDNEEEILSEYYDSMALSDD